MPSSPLARRDTSNVTHFEADTATSKQASQPASRQVTLDNRRRTEFTPRSKIISRLSKSETFRFAVIEPDLTRLTGRISFLTRDFLPPSTNDVKFRGEVFPNFLQRPVTAEIQLLSSKSHLNSSGKTDEELPQLGSIWRTSSPKEPSWSCNGISARAWEVEPPS
ncbi:hypothetical protein K3495_g11391 [Podosphaera aphanis]|nr:hypothetical protein K3495_g11391 [Podosphaera aphanis]